MLQVILGHIHDCRAYPLGYLIGGVQTISPLEETDFTHPRFPKLDAKALVKATFRIDNKDMNSLILVREEGVREREMDKERDTIVSIGRPLFSTQPPRQGSS